MFRVGDVILGLNIVIFLTAAFFLGVDSALYSILTYVAASKTLDFLLHGIEEYTAITIVSEQSDAIRQAITGVLGRGVTVYKGRGGMTGADQDILFCVVTRLEIGKVMDIAQEIDPSAFIVVYPLADAKGASSRRRPCISHAPRPDPNPETRGMIPDGTRADPRPRAWPRVALGMTSFSSAPDACGSGSMPSGPSPGSTATRRGTASRPGDAWRANRSRPGPRRASR